MTFIVNLKENILNLSLCVDKNGLVISTLILKKLIGLLKKMFNFSPWSKVMDVDGHSFLGNLKEFVQNILSRTDTMLLLKLSKGNTD